MIYTTNALESVNMRIRKTIKNRGHFPNDEAAIKLIYLALRNTMLKWKSSPVAWPEAARQFAISFGRRDLRNETFGLEETILGAKSAPKPRFGGSRFGASAAPFYTPDLK